MVYYLIHFDIYFTNTSLAHYKSMPPPSVMTPLPQPSYRTTSIPKITLDSYKENFSEPLEKYLSGSVESADGALMLLTLKDQKFKVVTGDFMKRHWNSKTLVSLNNIDNITKLYIVSFV